MNTPRTELLTYLLSELRRRESYLQDWKTIYKKVLADGTQKLIQGKCENMIGALPVEIRYFKHWIAWLEKQAD